MSIHIDKYGRAYTPDKETAMKYRVKDEQIQYHRIKKGLPEYDKYVPLYYYDKKEKIYWLPPSCGKGELISWLQEGNINECVFEDSSSYINIRLRPWQYEAVLKSEGEWRAKIICGSPSIGKSYILWTFASNPKHKTIVVVPTKVIWNWLYEKFKDEMFTSRTKVIQVDASMIRRNPDILKENHCIIITRASLYNVRDIVNDYDTYKFEQFLFDEAHYLWPSMQEMINTFKGKGILWVTATPRRKELNDEQFKLFFSDKIEIAGTVLPMKIISYEFKYDMPIEEYINITKDCKDPTAPEVLRTMTNECEKRIQLIKDITAERLWNKHIVLLLVDRVEELEKYKQFFPDAILIWGWYKWEEQLIDALNNYKPKQRILIIWTAQTCWTGFDYPEINSVILTFSTRRRNSIEQYAGRSRRSCDWKQYWEMCDIQDKWRINNQYRYFWSKERNDIYKELWYDVITKSVVFDYEYFITEKKKANENWNKRYC